MAELIPPRRNESLSNEDGTPTTRFAEYLEENASQTNTSTSEVEISTETINLSVGPNAAQSKRIDEIENTPEVNYSGQLSEIQKRLSALENNNVFALQAQIFKLQQQIDELKVL